MITIQTPKIPMGGISTTAIIIIVAIIIVVAVFYFWNKDQAN